MTETAGGTKPRNYVCTTCNRTYQAQRYVAKAQRKCSQQCKDAKRVGERKLSREEKKLQNRLEDFRKTAFGTWLFYEIRQAGTVEVLRAIKSPADLDDLYHVYSYSHRCHGADSETGARTYNLCHVAHRTGTNGSVGLLHAQNLFTGDASYNKSQKNKPTAIAVGMSISRSSCKRKWNVDKATPNVELDKLIRKYLGKNVFDAWLIGLEKKINLTTRNRLAREVYNAQQKGTAVPLPQRYSRAELESKSLEELQQFKKLQTGKECSSFGYDDYSSSWWNVYARELQRFTTYDVNAAHHSNCAGMLSCIRIIGEPDYSSLGYSTWNQFLQYRYPRTELGEFELCDPVIDQDIGSLLDHIHKSSFHALQGNDPGVDLLKVRIRKRFKVLSLVPNLDHATCLSYNPSAFWSREYGSFMFQTEQDWFTLQALGFVTEADIDAARATLLDDLANAHSASVARWRHMNRWVRDVPEWVTSTYGAIAVPDIDALLVAA